VRSSRVRTDFNSGSFGKCLFVAFLMSSAFMTKASSVPGGSLEPVRVRCVKVKDGFWSPKLRVYTQNTIPHSWKYVEDNIKAMKKIAGISDEPFKTGRWTEANLYKFIETVAYSVAVYPDAELEKKMDEVISAVAAAQQEDGYIHAHVTLNNLTPWGNLYHQHDGYVSGHLYEAAVAHFRATGKQTLLEVACRSADQACRYFLQEKNPGFPGHAEMELALVELYRVTGRERYLNLAREFIERRGRNRGKDCPRFPCEYFQDDVPVRRQDEIKGHAVRAVFFATGVADVALETGDPDMYAAAIKLWDSATKRRMYITGSVGASKKHEAFAGDYVLPNKGYTESCAACGLANFAHRMLMLQTDARCADVLERVLYNGILHGISLDGKSFYYRNPLTDKDHPRGNNWCCCPPTLSRTLMKVGEYAYLKGETDVYVNLYVGGKAEITLAGGKVTLTQQTDYPWSGRVKIIVSGQGESTFSINLRIPGWCDKASLRLNGAELKQPRLFKGYARIERQWKSGDLIELDLSMPVQRIEAHPNVGGNTGLVAIRRGAIVYGLEALDNGGNIDITLPIDPAFETEYVPQMLGGITVIKGKSSDGTPFTAIPFYALANRKKSSQVVWLSQQTKTTNPAGWHDRLYRTYSSFTSAR